MGKFLVIVESPTKAKTINKYLGNNYIVKSSFGHIRDLSSGKKDKNNHCVFLKKKVNLLDKKSLLTNSIGIDPYRGWRARYEILPGKEEIVHELSVLAKSADHIYLATDLDREGEAIAWHLKEVINVDNKKISRVIFNEITYNAIIRAFSNPTVLNIHKVNAQQARRFMDRLVGYMLSPLLWKKVARGLSAGRVQSVVVRLIVERERRIKKFIPKKYWELHVYLVNSLGNEFIFQVIRRGKSRFILTTYEDMQFAKDILLQFKHYIITDRTEKYLVNSPPDPFITVTLQQAAYSKFGYSIKKTMLLAQRLYEAGYITYMRTNSINISQAALQVVHSYIDSVYGSEYLSEKINRFTTSFCLNEAHEAIRPCNIYVFSELMDKNIDSNLKRLYHLIWCRFIASQMRSSQDIVITLLIQIGDFHLRASSQVCVFDGWKKVVSLISTNKAQNNFVSSCQIGDVLVLKTVLSTQHFTKAPIRYNEASLVKNLEKMGIGRPSTYVPIISTIQNRGYVYVHNSNFYATKIGEIVTDRLFENFCELMDYQFTANMENILDKIADSKEEWKHVLDNFFVKLCNKLEIAKRDFKDGGMRPNSIVMTDIVCELCGKNMGIRTAVTGVFLSCDGYNASVLKNRCKNTMNLVFDMNDNISTNTHSFYCKICNSMMDAYFIDNCRKLYVCINSPLCNGYIVEHGMFFFKEYSNSLIQCEKCMSTMSLKFGRFGKYVLCDNIQCKTTRKVLSNDCIVAQKSLLIHFPELLCQKSNAYFVLRDGQSGIFFAANTFPESKETRAPLVEELVRFRDRLPEQLSYLADAPVYDDHGNKTLVRFNRRSKEQYIVSVKNGKLTGWRSFFINGQWEIKSKK